MAVTISLDNIDVTEKDSPTATGSFYTYEHLLERERRIKEEAKKREVFKKVTKSFREVHEAWIESWENKLNIK